MAAVLSGDKSAALSGRYLCEVAPLSLSVQITHNELSVVVPRHSKLPITKTCTFQTAYDNQTSVKFDVFEGERFLSVDCDNGHLGTISMNELPSKRRGEVSIRVTFDVNASGVMQVTARELTTNKTASLQLVSSNRQRESQTVAAIIENAQKNSFVDEKHKERVHELRSFEDLVYARKHQEEDEKYPSGKVLFACERALQWIKDHGETIQPNSIRHRRRQFEEYYGLRRGGSLVNAMQMVKIN